MPYRRLPNTDMARLRALKKALMVGEQTAPIKMAFSSASLQKLKHFLPQFENMFHQQRSAMQTQANKSREYNMLMKKARLYVSHFYQVLNFAIARGDLAPASRKFYGLRENDSKVPYLMSEKDILVWGERLIKGESERLANGGNPMTNPTAAVVRVRYEQFSAAAHSQKILQKSTGYATERISGMRAEADQLILSIWDEVEKTYDLLPDEDKREKASQYGVVYVFRPYEREDKNNVSAEEEEFVTEDEMFDFNSLNKLRLDELSGDLDVIEKKQLQYSFSFSN